MVSIVTPLHGTKSAVVGKDRREMAKTAKAPKFEARRARGRNYFTPAISTLLDKRQDELRRGNWLEIGDAADLKPVARKKSRAVR